MRPRGGGCPGCSQLYEGRCWLLSPLGACLPFCLQTPLTQAHALTSTQHPAGLCGNNSGLCLGFCSAPDRTCEPHKSAMLAPLRTGRNGVRGSGRSALGSSSQALNRMPLPECSPRWVWWPPSGWRPCLSRPQRCPVGSVLLKRPRLPCAAVIPWGRPPPRCHGSGQCHSHFPALPGDAVVRKAVTQPWTSTADSCSAPGRASVSPTCLKSRVTSPLPPRTPAG